MNFASVMLCVVIAAAVIGAVVYMKKHKGESCCSMCSGDCEQCGKR